MPRIVFVTRRLLIRTAESDDADIYLALWTDPRAMTNVGFPEGLDTSRERISAQMGTEFERHLVVVRKEDEVRIGEATHEFAPDMPVRTAPVHHYVYRVSRETWARRKLNED